MNVDLEDNNGPNLDMTVRKLLGDGRLDTVLGNLKAAGGSPGIYNFCNGLFETKPTECMDGYRVKSTVKLPTGKIDTNSNNVSLITFFSSDMQVSSYQFEHVQ